MTWHDHVTPGCSPASQVFLACTLQHGLNTHPAPLLLLSVQPEGAHMNKYVELSPGGLELRDSVLEMAWNMLEVMRQYEVTHEQVWLMACQLTLLTSIKRVWSVLTDPLYRHSTASAVSTCVVVTGCLGL